MITHIPIPLVLDHPLTIKLILERNLWELEPDIQDELVALKVLQRLHKNAPRRVASTAEGRALANTATREMLTGTDDAHANIWMALLIQGSTDDITGTNTSSQRAKQPLPLGQSQWLLHLPSCGIHPQFSPTPQDQQWTQFWGDTFETTGTKMNSMIGEVTCNCGLITRQKIRADITHSLTDFIALTLNWNKPLSE